MASGRTDAELQSEADDIDARIEWERRARLPRWLVLGCMVGGVAGFGTAVAIRMAADMPMAAGDWIALAVFTVVSTLIAGLIVWAELDRRRMRRNFERLRAESQKALAEWFRQHEERE